MRENQPSGWISALVVLAHLHQNPFSGIAHSGFLNRENEWLRFDRVAGAGAILGVPNPVAPGAADPVSAASAHIVSSRLMPARFQVNVTNVTGSI
ncbi:MAG TPA: hypothetical protein VFI42_18775 [Thermomicrobiaceae bacterium]|nr:hypothetical protein [Thermomicrobiaceae bacterium]